MSNVFISSTGKDLAEYREAAIETCNRLQMVPVAMEFFEAMGPGATAGSRQKLEECDVYVGIFAHRYGYIEAGHSVSVTETEFEYAAERGLDRLCFLVAPDYPWPPDWIDYENHARLTTLKDRVNRSVIRMQFTTRDDFRSKLMQSLVEWSKRNGAARQGMTSPKQGAQTAEVMGVPRPRLVVGRASDTANLKGRLGVSARAPHAELTIVRGWPGVGKTTLVTALAHDPAVLAAFPDGLLWAALGPNGDPRSHLATWAQELGLTQNIDEPLDRFIESVRARLRNRRMLLIVDDAWKTEQASPFKAVAGVSCSLLVTTRFSGVARELATIPDEIYRLDVLSQRDSAELFRQVAPTAAGLYPELITSLLEAVEHLPLAIRVAARLLEGEAGLGGDVAGLLQQLRDNHRLLEEKAPEDRFDERLGTTPTIKLLLDRSTDSLGEPARTRFAMLGAFAPKPATFDQDAMRSVWEVEDPLPTIRQLVDRGLLEPIPEDGRFQIHAVLVMHAQSMLN